MEQEKTVCCDPKCDHKHEHKTEINRSRFKGWLWSTTRLVGIWAALWAGPFSICPHCGQTACIGGVATAGVFAGIVAFFFKIIEKVFGKKKSGSVHNTTGAAVVSSDCNESKDL